MRVVVVAVAVVFAVLWAPVSARADEQTAVQGAVRAMLSIDQPSSSGSWDLSLTITRGVQTLFAGAPSDSSCLDSCAPGGGPDDDSVRVQDLDGDGEPEVLIDLYSGGAHCCFIPRIYAFDGTGYRETGHNFGDPGYRLSDVDQDGIPELLSADGRFAYRFTSFASSTFPVQIWSFVDGRLYDNTGRHRDRIRADSARAWRLYRSAARRRQGYEPRGAIAAWAANEYRLGHRARTLRTLRSLARRGRLPGFPTRRQLRFVRELDGFLRRLGYAD